MFTLLCIYATINTHWVRPDLLRDCDVYHAVVRWMICCSLIILHLFYNQKVDAIELKKVSMSVLREYQS